MPKQVRFSPEPQYFPIENEQQKWGGRLVSFIKGDDPVEDSKFFEEYWLRYSVLCMISAGISLVVTVGGVLSDTSVMKYTGVALAGISLVSFFAPICVLGKNGHFGTF